MPHIHDPRGSELRAPSSEPQNDQKHPQNWCIYPSIVEKWLKSYCSCPKFLINRIAIFILSHAHSGRPCRTSMTQGDNQSPKMTKNISKIDALPIAPLKSDWNHVAAALNSYPDPISYFIPSHIHQGILRCTFGTPDALIRAPKWPKLPKKSTSFPSLIKSDKDNIAVVMNSYQTQSLVLCNLRNIQGGHAAYPWPKGPQLEPQNDQKHPHYRRIYPNNL